MLTYLFNIDSIFYRSFISFLLSFFISHFSYKRIICWNHKTKNGIKENVRNLGLIEEKKKIGIPTMGGFVMIFSTLISTILFSSLQNIYVIILIITLIFIGLIGFIDDYIKIKYHNKKGLSIMGKILGQTIISFFIGTIIYFYPNSSIHQSFFDKTKHGFQTTIPMFSQKYSKKEFDYSYILSWYNKKLEKYTWIIFIPIVIFIVIFFSNGSNITDGIDGLNAGLSAISFVTLSILSIISSNKIYSQYFHSIYIPGLEETIIFSCSFLGTLISYLWYNSYPAQIFMGDMGSLPIGGSIAILAILNRKELLLPFICGIFFMENISVLIQICYFKFSKKKYGIGRRIFRMTPIHHHFQKLGYHENKICSRFFIIQIILSILVFIFLI
ncbi:phospho-N-acetylmuramoyl-pentapeptide-transferase [Blattabacterium cuenoti]|uniref:phospho-N-acetylmuramoyl-pentapeptide- transferase n=1 Tax=Blattabacterium cuenoti TaxID=1653831 RepID=UPI00163BBC53|nr:phospho-N-acetylmuramoyl-pentapeptide-transferase [Blattabacterium cuenoti]